MLNKRLIELLNWLKNEEHKGKSNCIVITESNYTDFHKYSTEKSGNRNVVYKELKETISKKMLKQFIKYYPNQFILIKLNTILYSYTPLFL